MWQPEIWPIAYTIIISVRPYAKAIPRKLLAGEDNPKTTVKIVTDADPKKTSAKVPINSAT